jgi:hypothetical protein
VEFELLVDAPSISTSSTGWIRGNDQSLKSHHLDVVASDVLISGLILQPQSSGWFTFTTPRLVHETPRTIIVRATTGSQISAELLSMDSEPVGSTSGIGKVVLPYWSGAGTAFHLKISTTSTEMVPYSMLFATASDTVESRLPGDLDNDRDIDSYDLISFLAEWTGSLPPGTGGKLFENGDLDSDADVDSNDLLLMLGAWTGALQTAEPSLTAQRKSADDHEDAVDELFGELHVLDRLIDPPLKLKE